MAVPPESSLALLLTLVLTLALAQDNSLELIDCQCVKCVRVDAVLAELEEGEASLGVPYLG